ncbi:hypothetical protein C4D60_Mb09t18150 [Musa balbisiana]|uniref:LOB domain-containing protein n=1 Tax=Musa balbisiana TaxID=52838 RepID=A0A4S8II14_MUSBA|nr:hypothetical protein C4D60_Mb09t18150 [Musa balbisiana]
MSCNGCRVLRKGCGDDCSIRPSLQWIKNPESQTNDTVFLAKFYDRAGLFNLINARPEHLRSGTLSFLLPFSDDGVHVNAESSYVSRSCAAIFRSLLYEACGRVVNPINGSVGLLWSGSRQPAALPGRRGGGAQGCSCCSNPLRDGCVHPGATPQGLKHLPRGQGCRAPHGQQEPDRVQAQRLSTPTPAEPESAEAGILCWPRCYRGDSSHDSEPNPLEVGGCVATTTAGEGESKENESVLSAGVASQVSNVDEGEVELELTLGFQPASRFGRAAWPAGEARRDVRCFDADACKMDLCLVLPVA